MPDLAASWYVALPSRDLTRRPVPLTLFGRALVAWRADAGRAAVLPRACPHMGASLAHGRAIDGLLECPFHGWRFDGSGACVQITGSDRIPAAAHRQPYPTVERHGYVWVWYGSAEPMFALPELPALDTAPPYRRLRRADRTTTSVRRVLERAYDPGHLAGLPGVRVEGPLRSRVLAPADLAGRHGPPVPADACFGVELLWSGRTHRVTVRVDGWPAGQRISVFVDGTAQYRLLLAATPVAPDHTIRHTTMIIEGTGRIWAGLPRLMTNRIRLAATSGWDRPGPGDGRRDGPPGGDPEGVRLFRQHYRWWVDRVVDGA
ncbi:Rieske 2Fe-2S domain-containing protein [Micromonospora sp. NPDC051141]|uniref:Rieske 2Fe-2S domain-containing protein n=1 Tax=Micromonospora sp. NPDC051141 TaxID=3364284 RepID=UPI0037A310BC